jgi:hypothetical protein
MSNIFYICFANLRALEAERKGIQPWFFIGQGFGYRFAAWRESLRPSSKDGTGGSED